jgi:ferrous iron transport protein B
MANAKLKVALVGNPNTGKSSVFNHLTGLNQHVGNFPGVTVDKKTGECQLTSELWAEILDVPGTYSIFPRSKDERVVIDVLADTSHANHPEQLVVLLDASNLERNLLVYTQLADLRIPMIGVLTMNDVAVRRGVEVDVEELSRQLGNIPVLRLNGRSGEGIPQLKQWLAQGEARVSERTFGSKPLGDVLKEKGLQKTDAEERYRHIRAIVRHSTVRKGKPVDVAAKLDRWFVHPVWGYTIFLSILLLIFQVIYRIASFPMDWIDGAFLDISQAAKTTLPEGVLTDLVAEGIVPGIGGVVVFVPQIALLFFFLAILEETGYMSRVVFIMDKLVRPFGLNGKSVVPLMSSAACAIPGIMAARNINNWKDRIITIMVAPLMSCSARIPVFTLLIALVVPEKTLWGFFDFRGLVLFALYALGLVSAISVAFVLKHFVASGQKGFLIMELPTYQWPRWKHIVLSIWEKVKVFLFDAGKIILAISIVLWALASYGPGDRMEKAAQAVLPADMNIDRTEEMVEREQQAARLEQSYIGLMGHAIEPVIRPLGYDWKIGIALVTSFAAREVFVGSMAAIYSAGEDFEEDTSLLERMRDEKNPDTGLPVYTLASGMSLMVFYVYAMQCMATFAIVKRETKSWKWPVIQLVYMGILAYAGAWLTFIVLS